MQADGRLTTMDWRHYDGVHCVFQPMQMPSEVLEEGCYWAWRTFYGIPSIARRILKPGEKVLEIAANMYFNWAYRRMVQRLPPGSLTPLAEIFDRLQADIDGATPIVGDLGRDTVATLQIQLGRDYLHGNGAISMQLEGLLDEQSAPVLKDRIITLVKTTGSDLIVHCAGLATATPKALQLLLDGTRSVFEHHGTHCIFQGLSASLRAWWPQLTLPSYVSVIEAHVEVSAAGD
jgi:anti-anti-sigma regulatory factor